VVDVWLLFAAAGGFFLLGYVVGYRQGGRDERYHA
jgi:hypothetical protein